MRIAVFSDIHGSKHALDAVLADIPKHEPDLVVCLGDLVGYGAYPDAVVQVIRESGIFTVKGNYDDAIANQRMACGCDYKDETMEAGLKSISWTMENTSAESKEFMLSLPDRMNKEIHGLKVLFVHGSPRQLNEYLYEDIPAADILLILQEADADVLVCGHTHLPEIYEIIGLFGDAAARACEAGYDAVEIIGSAGYLICQFLSPVTNQRTDEFGGSLENHMRQITMDVPGGAYIYLAQGIKQEVKIPVIACNRINNPQLADLLKSS